MKNFRIAQRPVINGSPLGARFNSIYVRLRDTADSIVIAKFISLLVRFNLKDVDWD